MWLSTFSFKGFHPDTFSVYSIYSLTGSIYRRPQWVLRQRVLFIADQPKDRFGLGLGQKIQSICDSIRVIWQQLPAPNWPPHNYRGSQTTNPHLFHRIDLNLFRNQMYILLYFFTELFNFTGRGGAGGGGGGGGGGVCVIVSFHSDIH